MSIDTTKRLAQIDWGEALDEGSIQALDERLGILAAMVTMPSGNKRPVLFWNDLSFPLTFEIVEQLAEWSKAQRQGETA